MKARDYQAECHDTFFDNVDNGIQAMVVNLFTGGGKTFLAAMVAKEWKKRSGGKVLFLVDQIELAYQAAEEFATFDPSFRVGIEMNYHHARVTDDIIISCVATIGKGSGGRIGKFSPEDFTLIICDEAHKSIAPIWRKVLAYFEVDRTNFADFKALLGFTATVKRADRKPLGLIYDDVVGGYDIRWAVKNGWATDIEVYQIQTNSNLDNIDFNKETGEFNQLQLEQAINTADRNAQIVKAYKEISDGELAVVYATSVDHAYQIAELFNTHGIPAYCIESNTDKDDRKDAIKRFKNHEILVLTNYMVLTTGFNVKEVTTGILARPIGSETTFIQTIGRFVRPSDSAFVDQMKTREQRIKAILASDKPYAKIIDFRDATERHSVVSVPSLFGLNNKILDGEKKKFFSEVLEPLEEMQEKAGIDIRHVTDLKDVQLFIKKKSISMKMMSPTESLRGMSKNKWYEIDTHTYQMNLPKAKRVIRVEENEVGKWEVSSHDLASDATRLLNKMASLSGAVKLADDYAEEIASEDLKFADIDAGWRKAGLTSKHWNFFYKIFKWYVNVSEERYPDTGEKMLYWKKTGDLVTRGSATDAMEQKQINSKIKTNAKKEVVNKPSTNLRDQLGTTGTKAKSKPAAKSVSGQRKHGPGHRK